MYILYIDESGTPDIPGNTSHYVLSGIAIPIWKWKNCDIKIQSIKQKYNLQSTEIHTGWIARQYNEQLKIPGFQLQNFQERRRNVENLRNKKLLELQKSGNQKTYSQTRKNYIHTSPYIHLSIEERISFLKEIAETIGGWGEARLFAECIDKTHFDAHNSPMNMSEQAFTQVISRFEQFLKNINKNSEVKNYGILIHDNNETVSKKHTDMMQKFHKNGTLWIQIENIIETPLFVDSSLTSMIQIADLCAYSLRRYLENGEDYLFKHIFERADRKDGITVGIRHFTKPECQCIICKSHRSQPDFQNKLL